MGFIVFSHMTDIYRVGECHAVVLCKDVEISKNFKRPLILGKIRRHLY